MQDYGVNRGTDLRAARASGGRGLRAILAITLLVIVGGGGWYAWHAHWLPPVTDPAPSETASAPASSPSAATVALVAQGNLQGNLIATNAALADATARLTALQQRLAELNQQAAAASGQATRAEALLVALATRRAIERGQPLGYLDTALRLRFGESQRQAVEQVTAAAQKPVTIGALTEEFIALEPRLVSGPANESTLDWLGRQVGSMFIIRHDDKPSPAPASRIARARAALAGQRVDMAISEVDGLPGKDAATDWLAHARDWVKTQNALAQIESAALAIPTPTPPPPTADPSASPR